MRDAAKRTPKAAAAEAVKVSSKQIASEWARDGESDISWTDFFSSLIHYQPL
jgi:hypothetical protein